MQLFAQAHLSLLKKCVQVIKKALTLIQSDNTEIIISQLQNLSEGEGYRYKRALTPRAGYLYIHTRT